jgi:uncharacterized protein (DUF1684 family)
MEDVSVPGQAMRVLDWRRQVAALYAEVRACAEPALAHERWRTGRDELLRTHTESPVPLDERDRFPGAPVAAYDPSFRFETRIDLDVASRSWKVPTGTDGTVVFDRVGVATLEGLGPLDVWWLRQYGGGLFIPVRDALSGTHTYGGGRYVLDTCKGADLGSVGGRLVVDLNFAYNPSCAYDPMWACPLAPEGNVLDVPLPVGETVVRTAEVESDGG